MTRPGRVIDAYIHFWDPSHVTYTWLEADNGLRRSLLPVDLPELATPVDG